MFSGKTEELIRRLRRAQFANQVIAIFKPSVDNRYSDVEVVSHDSHSITSKPIKDAAEMLKIGPDVQVVGIDEAYLGKPFGPIPALMAIAEDVQKVHAICVKCGGLANHSHRLSKSRKLVVLGEKDIYEPLCRECFNKALAED